jgi:hypothetical protein
MDQNAYQFGAHSDVLNAKPEDDASKERLLGELKSRGNAAFKKTSYMEADVLYSKCIEYAPTEHTYYSNRSMTRLKMSKSKDALEDADKCVELKEDWSKVRNALIVTNHATRFCARWL